MNTDASPRGLNPKYHHDKEVTCFKEVARQVHIEPLPTWKIPKHGQQWINTLADCSLAVGRLFHHIGLEVEAYEPSRLALSDGDDEIFTRAVLMFLGSRPIDLTVFA